MKKSGMITIPFTIAFLGILLIASAVYLISMCIVGYIWVETKMHMDLFEFKRRQICDDHFLIAILLAPFTLMFLLCYAIYKPFKKKKEEEKKHKLDVEKNKRYRTQYKKCLVKNHKYSLYGARIKLQRIEKYIII